MPVFSSTTLPLLTLAFLLNLSQSGFADPVNEFYIQQSVARFFNLPRDAKDMSLAGSRSAVSTSSYSIFANPAGLGFMKRGEVAGTLGFDRRAGREFISEDFIEERSSNGHLTFAYPLSSDGDEGTIAVAYSRYNGKADDSINTRVDGHTRSIAYGIPLSNSTAAGYSFTFFDDQLRSDLADYHAHARLRHTLGLQHKVHEDLTLGGLLFYGLGQSDSEEFSVMSDGLTHQKQWSSDLGGVYQVGDRTALSSAFTIDWYTAEGDLDVTTPRVIIGDDEDGTAFGLRLGIEHSLTDAVDIRAGYRFQRIRGYHYERSELQTLSGGVEFNAFSTGIGYAFNPEENSLWSGIRIDYGIEYQSAGEGETEHLLTVAVPFA